MSVYAVNKLCRRVVHEPELRRALAEHPEQALRAARPALSEEEVQLVLDGEVGELGLRGCNYFLLHQLGRWEVLGLDLQTHGDRVRAANGFTRLFVHPERYIRTVDGLITGLHDPQATHLAMLTAIAGEPMIASAYAEALREGYLWHEFGDSHLILRSA